MGLLSRLIPQQPARLDPSQLRDFVVVDVETTGLRPGSDRVLSIAALGLDSQGIVTSEFSTLLNPGCDPGPVHIHGLTRERLSGAPAFNDVLADLTRHLDGRTMVAHNARFDHAMLAAEAQRAGARLPTQERLCTLALARRLDIPAPDYRLPTLAQYWRIPHVRPHDALDDARAVAGVFGKTRALAAKIGLPLPFTSCEPHQGFLTTDPPRTPCAFAWPGAWDQTGPLVQGMKVVVTGPTRMARERLAAAAIEAGLEFMHNVSGRTALVVCNDTQAASGKLRDAATHGVQVVDETRFLRMLGEVLSGRAKGSKAPAKPASASPTPRFAAPRTRRRVLVLGGPHAAATALRERLVEQGAEVASNLSLSVTEVVLLEGGDADPRAGRAWDRGLPLLGPDLQPLSRTGEAQPDSEPAMEDGRDIVFLARGQVVDLPDAGSWTVTVSWSAEQVPAGVEADVVAFRLGSEERVLDDTDFVFWNQPATPDEAVAVSVDGDAERSVTLDLDELGSAHERLVIAAALSGDATFGSLGPVELSVEKEGRVVFRSTLDAATTERTMLLAEVYRRGDVWRIRAVGQGYDTGIDQLCCLYGLEIA